MCSRVWYFEEEDNRVCPVLAKLVSYVDQLGNYYIGKGGTLPFSLKYANILLVHAQFIWDHLSTTRKGIITYFND